MQNNFSLIMWKQHSIAKIKSEKNPREQLLKEWEAGFWKPSEYLRETSKRLGSSKLNIDTALTDIALSHLGHFKI